LGFGRNNAQNKPEKPKKWLPNGCLACLRGLQRLKNRYFFVFKAVF
jgi:hypothetical protein